MPLIETHYTAEELSKVPAGNYEFVDTEACLEAIAYGMRAYGYATIPGSSRDQIVAIRGQRDLDRFQLHALWLSHNTTRDLIRPA